MLNLSLYDFSASYILPPTRPHFLIPSLSIAKHSNTQVYFCCFYLNNQRLTVPKRMLTNICISSSRVFISTFQTLWVRGTQGVHILPSRKTHKILFKIFNIFKFFQSIGYIPINVFEFVYVSLKDLLLTTYKILFTYLHISIFEFKKLLWKFWKKILISF